MACPAWPTARIPRARFDFASFNVLGTFYATSLGKLELLQSSEILQMMITLFAIALVLFGALILAGSLFITRRLIVRLPEGPLHRYWHVMQVLVMTFLAGYLVYFWVFWNSHTRLLDLFVPGILFLGACFVWLTSNLCLQTALAVMRISLLEQENIADPLTGVYNRRYLDRRLSEEVTRARRHGQPLSALLLDIDHFKHINDRHGHQAGDQVLTAFAALVKKQLREPDIVARYGGEEFMVIAPHTPHRGAVDLAERLRRNLESNSFALTGMPDGTQAVRLTCSIGVVSLGDESDRVETLIRLADENLYRAKQEGRNRVNAYVPSATAAANLVCESLRIAEAKP
jgi:diguanylate cyclase (GGDEF)-like protein